MKFILKLTVVFGLLVGCYVSMPETHEYFRNTYDVFMALIYRASYHLADDREEEEPSETVKEVVEDYYYSCLTHKEKRLYEQMKECIERQQEDFLPEVPVDHEELNRVYEAVFYDQPQFFYLDSTYSYTYAPDDSVLRVRLAYYSFEEEFDVINEKFMKACGEIILPAKELTSDYAKEKYVHDQLVNNVTYELKSNMNQSAYSALVNHKTVCAGYSRAFQYILKQLGIPCYYVTGTSEGQDHAWNIALIDHEYYNVDVTWDHAVMGTDPYFFFNLSDRSFDKTHTRSEMSEGLPKCTSEKLAHMEDAGIWERVIFRIPHE